MHKILKKLGEKNVFKFKQEFDGSPPYLKYGTNLIKND